MSVLQGGQGTAIKVGMRTSAVYVPLFFSIHPTAQSLRHLHSDLLYATWRCKCHISTRISATPACPDRRHMMPGAVAIGVRGNGSDRPPRVTITGPPAAMNLRHPRAPQTWPSRTPCWHSKSASSGQRPRINSARVLASATDIPPQLQMEALTLGPVPCPRRPRHSLNPLRTQDPQMTTSRTPALLQDRPGSLDDEQHAMDVACLDPPTRV